MTILLLLLNFVGKNFRNIKARLNASKMPQQRVENALKCVENALIL
jgi:hypothetical protein